MNILVTAATEAEITPFIAHLSANWNNISKNVFQHKNLQVVVLFTGVGMVATTYTLTKALSGRRYDLVLQVGIAGSFSKTISIGDTVFIISEQCGDLGAEDHENYLDVFEIGLADADGDPYTNTRLDNPLSDIHDTIDLAKAKGLTINTVSGKQQTIDRLIKRYNCEVESMEGAAFHYVCLMEQVRFAQVRSISNYIEPRDRSKWQIGLAIENLNKWLVEFTSKL